MIWAMIAVVILTLFAVAILFSRNSENRVKSRIEERVEAYRQTIRRTKEPPQYEEMTDTELGDILTSAARKLQAEQHRRTMILLTAGAMTLVAAIFIGAENGVQAFGITIVAGLIATYGVNLVLVRRTREWFAENDLNAERLAID